MAFLNKRVRSSKSEGSVINSESNGFNKNNVRVLLFKESKSKGRKLIFDSSVMDSLPRNVSDDIVTSPINIKKLTDMVFGVISLRCHETYFRIHNLTSSNRIMFTQVFPFPGSKKISFSSFPRHLPSTLSDVDVVYLRAATCDTNLEDSSLSLELGISGILLDSQVFHYGQYNTPNSSTSTIDSGYAEQSCSNFTASNRSSFNSGLSLNCEHSKINNMESRTFLTDPVLYSTDSFEDYYTKTCTPTLGLVIILAVTADNDEYYLKHIAFIESVVFRIRQNIELAFSRPGILLSLMVKVSHESTQWLIRMFPCLQEPHTVECNRVNRSKISLLLSNTIFPKKCALYCKTTTPRSAESENYFDEICELLMKLENKETNFFISTIITATLTYHLGWITTCFSDTPANKNLLFRTKTNAYNSLWRQMTELYGAHGSPTKSAQTIINGSSQNDTISKLLRCIKYFVRYVRVIRHSVERINVDKDNENADKICRNYKHTGINVLESVEQKSVSVREIKPTLKKSKAWSSNLSELSSSGSEEIDTSQEENVTFLLGENEELVNIRPHLMSSCKTPSIKVTSSNETTELDTPKINHKTNIIHSNCSSALDDVFDSTKQKQTSRYSELVTKANNNRHSQSEFPNMNQEMCDLETSYRNLHGKFKLKENEEDVKAVIRSPLNIYYPDEKDEQVLCINKNERTFHKIRKMKIFCFPLPSSRLNKILKTSYASTLESDIVGNYVPEMVIQGTNMPEKEWMLKLKRDLYLTRQIFFSDGYVDESIAVVGNTDKWNVEIISSRVSINQSSMGTKLDVSSLVANMLEVLLEMCNLHFCKKYNATHIEQRLLEICIRSCAFSQLLMHTDMCTMNLLTTTLQFEINDIPLLMSVASIIAPQVTKKYGLSFQ